LVNLHVELVDLDVKALVVLLIVFVVLFTAGVFVFIGPLLGLDNVLHLGNAAEDLVEGVFPPLQRKFAPPGPGPVAPPLPGLEKVQLVEGLELLVVVQKLNLLNKAGGFVLVVFELLGVKLVLLLTISVVFLKLVPVATELLHGLFQFSLLLLFDGLLILELFSGVLSLILKELQFPVKPFLNQFVVVGVQEFGLSLFLQFLFMSLRHVFEDTDDFLTGVFVFGLSLPQVLPPLQKLTTSLLLNTLVLVANAVFFGVDLGENADLAIDLGFLILGLLLEFNILTVLVLPVLVLLLQRVLRLAGVPLQ